MRSSRQHYLELPESRASRGDDGMVVGIASFIAPFAGSSEISMHLLPVGGDFLHAYPKIFAKKSTPRFSPHDRHLQASHSAKAERAKTPRPWLRVQLSLCTFSSGIPSGDKSLQVLSRKIPDRTEKILKTARRRKKHRRD